MIAGGGWNRLGQMRRFNTRTISAGEVQCLVNSLFLGRSLGAHSRAERLLLTWWAIGHDPKRHIACCTWCEGDGEVGGYTESFTCPSCHGTGKE